MLLIGTNAFADSRLKEEMYESSFLGSGNIIVSKVSNVFTFNFIYKV